MGEFNVQLILGRYKYVSQYCTLFYTVLGLIKTKHIYWVLFSSHFYSMFVSSHEHSLEEEEKETLTWIFSITLRDSGGVSLITNLVKVSILTE